MRWGQRTARYSAQWKFSLILTFDCSNLFENYQSSCIPLSFPSLLNDV
jgi:hypothetical protein